ncbi:hypothetical protein CEXT_263751 [Caerostris extrusa]|uniref:Uncharacterized protein n=1 Tax=Caerostris extrusa TaxID=172846 RepID=A0AAV4Q5D5_CAEEX|nr:hypothetical protein CEXT_263751 [Caerostris extrusa]
MLGEEGGLLGTFPPFHSSSVRTCSYWRGGEQRRIGRYNPIVTDMANIPTQMQISHPGFNKIPPPPSIFTLSPPLWCIFYRSRNSCSPEVSSARMNGEFFFPAHHPSTLPLVFYLDWNAIIMELQSNRMQKSRRAKSFVSNAFGINIGLEQVSVGGKVTKAHETQVFMLTVVALSNVNGLRLLQQRTL